MSTPPPSQQRPPQPPTGPPVPEHPGPLPVATKLTAAVLLLIPCVALAAVPTYSHESPKLGGWPFFYWYQLMWVLITPVLTIAAYVVIKRARDHR